MRIPDQDGVSHRRLGTEVLGTKRYMVGKYQNVRAYVAGPPPAVDATIRGGLLLEAKLSADNIRYDKFS
jgi:hypothetical protein